jgi:integrase
MGIEKARQEARKVIERIHTGADLAGPQSFKAVCDDWWKRHVERKGLRSADNKRGILANHLLPHFAGRNFVDLRRHDIAKMLDHVEENAGPVAADSTLNVLSSICHWYESRHESYVVPTSKRMRRTSTKERARKRILDDEELRAVWKAADGTTFGALVRLLLLTAQRREKVVSMRWEDVSSDGVWSIPTEAREKGNAETLPLPSQALELIRALPRMAGNPFVLAGRGGVHLNSFGKGKEELDAKVAELLGAEPPNWTLHDLRRTARSLLSRAGVLSEHAEKVLGHAVGTIEATYDLHRYEDQKGAALVKLAGLIEKIINPPADNVVHIRDAG